MLDVVDGAALGSGRSHQGHRPQAGESTGGANNRAQRQRRQTILTEPRDQFAALFRQASRPSEKADERRSFELGESVARQRDREPCLPDPARAGQRDEALAVGRVEAQRAGRRYSLEKADLDRVAQAIARASARADQRVRGFDGSSPSRCIASSVL